MTDHKERKYPTSSVKTAIDFAHQEGKKIGFDACLKMIEEERNILQNTGSFMWHEPEDQKKTLHIAECLSVTLKYINELKKLRK